MHQPTTSIQESVTGPADIARRAQDLREKAQQLALDELCIMNQAVGLNLLAKQLADATMRPAAPLAPTGLPLSFILSNGLSNPLQQQALQAQLRAQVLAGATQHGMHGLQAAAAAARPPPQQLQHMQATTASSAGIAGLPLHKQQQEAAADAGVAAAQDCRSLSSSQQECGSGNEAACVDADTAAEKTVP